MCEGLIRVEQILAGRNHHFWELSPFLNFFWNTNKRLDFWGSIDWRPIPLKINIAAKSHSLWTRAEPACNTKQSALTKRAFCRPSHPLGLAFLVDFSKSPNPPWKHLRLPIRDWERGWINYSKHWFQTQSCFSCFLFFVLRTAEWRRTVSLWLWTSFCLVKAEWELTSNRPPPALDRDSPGHIVRQNRWHPARSHGPVGCRSRIQQKVAVSFVPNALAALLPGLKWLLSPLLVNLEKRTEGTDAANVKCFHTPAI